MRNRSTCCAALTASLFATSAIHAQVDSDATSQDDAGALTLERIFPKKSMYGPSANGMTFSQDGRFGSFLYRSYTERRHGSDLYIFDTQTGKSRRVTSVSRMAQYQEDARKVRDDRKKKAKKAGVRIAGDDASESSIVGDWDGIVRSSSTRTVTKDEACTLSFKKGKGDSISGTLSTGIITLSLRDISVDDEGHFEGKIGEEESNIEGIIECDLKDGVLDGTVSLDSPNMRFSFRVEPKTGDDSDEPTGVLGATGERLTLGDVVLEDDATINDDDDDDKDDKKEKDKAPRYSGVRSVEWSPTASELIFISGGDLYLLKIDQDRWNDEDELYLGELSRLTVTQERERSVKFLPDGSGYTYLRDGSLIKITWGSHLIEQIDPSLESGESMAGYRISPDQKRLVFIASKGRGPFSGGVKVNIVNYRSRFAQIREVTRKMSDDPMSVSESSIYLYDLTGHDEEKGTLKKVFTRKRTGPRDTMAVPTWAPDSSKIAFAAFDQATSQVHILEAGFKDEEADDEDEGDKDGEENEADAEDDDADEDTEDEDADEENADGDNDDEPEFVIEDARVVYKFLHNGGPNTPRMIMPQYLADSRRLVFLTEISGYRQLHVLDPVYEQLTQLTEGQFEVYPFDVSEDHDRVFVTSTRGDPTQRHIFIVDLESGEMTQLSTEEGVYSRVAISDDGSTVLATHADFGSPRELVSITAEGETVRLTESHPEETMKLSAAKPEYFTYQNRHDQTIHGHMFKPNDWAEGDKRPLLIYVYGGPLGETKMVTRGSFSAPSYFFARYMTEVHGYITATIDPRGSSGYGGLFEKANFEQVGVPQTEDLVDAAKWLVENHGVDEDRMALHGWSFGGFQTQMVMYTEPDVFAVGIAGAGPTEWENYNSWYSTGTIGPSREGHTDLEKYSLLPKAKNLKGILLLVHGMEDSNVLYQDTVHVYRELLKAGKETQVELFLDPTGGHGLGGDVKTMNKFHKFEDFLVRRMGEGAPAESSDDEEKIEEEAAGTGDKEDDGTDG